MCVDGGGGKFPSFVTIGFVVDGMKEVVGPNPCTISAEELVSDVVRTLPPISWSVMNAVRCGGSVEAYAFRRR